MDMIDFWIGWLSAMFFMIICFHFFVWLDKRKAKRRPLYRGLKDENEDVNRPL